MVHNGEEPCRVPTGLRDEAAKLLNCSFADLAEKLGITTAAVAQWGDDKEIPLLREIQVKELAAGRNPLFKSKAKRNISQSKI